MITSDYLDSRHGGVETHVFYLSRALKALGHEVHVVRASPEPSRYVAPAAVQCSHLSPGPISRSADRCVGRLSHPLAREFIKRAVQNLDVLTLLSNFPAPTGSRVVIHQHDFVANLALSKALARRYPVLWTNHLGEFLLFRRSGVGRALLPRMTAHYAFAMAPSRELADIPGMHGRVVPNASGVDSRHFRPATAAEQADGRRAFGWTPDEFVVLVPRRWAPTKGVVYAAQALRHMDDLPNVRFVFVGAGVSEYPTYAAKVAAALRPHEEMVDVVDHVDQPRMRDYYRAADLTLIPSLAEAVSLAALEAMACGSPVVASRVGGMPELIVEGENGLLTAPGDPQSIAHAVRAVAALGSNHRSSMRRAARETAEGHDWMVIARSAVSLYERAIAARPTRHGPPTPASPARTGSATKFKRLAGVHRGAMDA